MAFQKCKILTISLSEVVVELLNACVDAAVFEFEAVKALHANDGKEVVEQQEDNHG